MPPSQLKIQPTGPIQAHSDPLRRLDAFPRLSALALDYEASGAPFGRARSVIAQNSQKHRSNLGGLAEQLRRMSVVERAHNVQVRPSN
jgi:hypothetical protein